MRESILVTFIHEDEIYVIKRQNDLPVFPGYHSFPGGKVEAEDQHSSWPSLSAFTANHPPHLINALRRELIEEVDLDIDQLLKRNEILALRAVGVAITPDFNPYRFKNYYFIIIVKNKPVLTVENREIEKGEWKKPSAYLQEYYQHKMLIVPPMRLMLEAMDKKEYYQEHNFELPYDPLHEVPMIESLFGVRQFLPLSHTFPPANRTNCFLIGDQKKVCIDPSPCDDREYRKLKNSLLKYGVDFIFITHHHPDHYERSSLLARELKVGLGLSADTLARILKKEGPDYFKDIELTIFKEGMTLTTSGQKEIKIYSIPGHDEGQLGLAPVDHSWFLVGDLIQSVGTVVIALPEGDMSKYFASLKRVIDLNPLHIIPSHGIALGGVVKLQETLKHRQKREEQIRPLLQAQKNNKEILNLLYPDLPPQLHLYALKTIEAHIQKIERENIS